MFVIFPEGFVLCGEAEPSRTHIGTMCQIWNILGLELIFDNDFAGPGSLDSHWTGPDWDNIFNSKHFGSNPTVLQNNNRILHHFVW